MTNTLVRTVALSIPGIRDRYNGIMNELTELKAERRALWDERNRLLKENNELSSTQLILKAERDHMKYLLDQNFSRIMGKLSTMEYALVAKLGDVQAGFPGSSVNRDSNSFFAKAYLDLLEKALVGLLYCDIPMNATGEHSFLPEIREIGWDWPSQALTMIGKARMQNLRFLCESVIERGVPGDFIETGVWRGGACIYMRAILHAYSDTQRKVWVADSFEGLPPPDAEKYPADEGDPHHTLKELAISLETVRENFERFGLLDAQVCFLKGWFKDTLPVAPIEKLAILRLDGDMYESTIDALENLYDRVSDGGFIIIDDFCLHNCRQAVTDFRNARNIDAPLIEVDGVAVYWQK